MIILVLGFIASLIPSIALYIWIRSLKSDQLYKDSCKKTFIAGLIAVIPVVLLSLIFNILKNILFPGLSPLLSALIYNFVVIALAEELVLLIVFILFIRRARNDEKYTAPLFPEMAA